MILNESPSVFPRPPYAQPKLSQPKPHVAENTLQSCELHIERKTFILALKENPRGRFLRITEIRQPRSTAIIIPAPGLKDVQEILAAMLNAANERPPLTDAPKLE